MAIAHRLLTNGGRRITSTGDLRRLTGGTVDQPVYIDSRYRPPTPIMVRIVGRARALAFAPAKVTTLEPHVHTETRVHLMAWMPNLTTWQRLDARSTTRIISPSWSVTTTMVGRRAFGMATVKSQAFSVTAQMTSTRVSAIGSARSRGWSLSSSMSNAHASVGPNLVEQDDEEVLTVLAMRNGVV